MWAYILAINLCWQSISQEGQKLKKHSVAVRHDLELHLPSRTFAAPTLGSSALSLDLSLYIYCLLPVFGDKFFFDDLIEVARPRNVGIGIACFDKHSSKTKLFMVLYNVIQDFNYLI